MNSRIWGGWGGLAGFAFLSALRSGPNFADMTIDEVEAWWVASRIRARRSNEEQSMRNICDLARAFGPYHRTFGFRMGAAVHSKSKSASLERMLGRKQYKRAA